MKKTFYLLALVAGFATLYTAPMGCTSTETQKTDSAITPRQLTHAELLVRGKYLVNAGGCNDCHTPKIFSPQGMSLDTAKLLSGHPANMPPSVDKQALKPGYGYVMGPFMTSFCGPWGISFSANLTPDSTTGLGNWTADTFIKTIRTGKHLGQEGGRPLLPAMPWQTISNYTDEDLEAIFVYLQAIPAINNQVPAPVSPVDVAKMK